ncbi:ABC transporter ATP-binding protein [Oryzicola mucosus]|uniref:ABC transporter ATP-binding protein n=1 Tax=Oryzicola mucosus TaxID=2767425 RepID=A0A8J6PWA1_9HYPH|nr:ABC transporter ATP-binding protein [Oryzicola mucosus]MBD0417434.1 ABC transporter ATP-binding protein [Oryzicola mucosus]
MTQILKLEGLMVRFGGLTAVNGVSLTIASGEIRGLIGPNGAGKTTLFNAISGLAPASAGSVHLDGLEITSKSAPQRAALGIRRTFQTVQLVQSFTVYENLLFGLHTRAGNPLTRLIVGSYATPDADADAIIDEVLDYLGMRDLKHRVVDTLTIAHQRYVEIGRALVARPKLLMLDEPTAGLSPAQIERLDDLIGRLSSDWKVSILLVEHVIPLVVKLCSRITVLDRGRVIAEGTGAEIGQDAAVQKAYLGERLDA